MQRARIVAAFALLCAFIGNAHAERIKELAQVAGVRGNRFPQPWLTMR